jgi:hypothetical protein
MDHGGAQRLPKGAGRHKHGGGEYNAEQAQHAWTRRAMGLDHRVGHPVLIDLPHGSLWWTEGRRRYLDSFQYSGKHRAASPGMGRSEEWQIYVSNDTQVV